MSEGGRGGVLCGVYMYVCMYVYIYIYVHIVITLNMYTNYDMYYMSLSLSLYKYIYIYIYIGPKSAWVQSKGSGARAPVLHGNLREQTRENDFPR